LFGAAATSLGLAALLPLRSLGPTPGNALRTTSWRAGSRALLDGRPIRAADIVVGSVITVFPDTEAHEDSATLLLRVDPSALQLPEGRAAWAPDGIVAYSKICTHVGCPVGLYRETTHELLCPCHQSTFDVLRGARPVFGPATRSLPQLPLRIDEEGYITAISDYAEPVGPSFWNRERR
jgi:ubiquinol-cytochrome c reductase iron-sulfur subunit